MSEEEKLSVLDEERDENVKKVKIDEKIEGEQVEEDLGEVLEAKKDTFTEDEEIVEKEIFYDNAVNKGDFIYIEMTGKVLETGDVFDTTNEEIAKENGIFDEKKFYGPRLIIVGDGYILKGLDEQLPGTKFNEEVDVEIPPEDAFGMRNADLVQMIPYRVLRSKGINPYVGAELEIDGRIAVIRSVGAGRVQVDYNHSLAGRKIVYTVKIINRILEDKAKMQALIGKRFLGINADKFKINKTKKKIKISLPEQVFFSENIQLAKRGVALDLLRYFKDFEEVEFHETVKRT